MTAFTFSDVAFVRPPAPSGGGARDADASKFYWWAPDSVVESGGTVTEWTNKVSGGPNLVQVASLARPTFASGQVNFNGSQVLGVASHPYANSLRAVLVGGGSVALWLVLTVDASGQTPSTLTDYIVLVEGTGVPFENQHFTFFATGDSFGAPPFSVGLSAHSRGFSDAFFFERAAMSSGRNGALQLWRFVITQTTISWRAHPSTATGSDSVTPGNVPDSVSGLYVGAQGDGGIIRVPFVGGIREIYATTDTGSTNVDAITAELETEYGL
jgi:hypothetical protein